MFCDFCLNDFPELKFIFWHNPLFATTETMYSMWPGQSHYLRGESFIVLDENLEFDGRLVRALFDHKFLNVACINKSSEQPNAPFKGRTENDLLKLVEQYLAKKRLYPTTNL